MGTSLQLVIEYAGIIIFRSGKQYKIKRKEEPYYFLQTDHETRVNIDLKDFIGFSVSVKYAPESILEYYFKKLHDLDLDDIEGIIDYHFCDDIVVHLFDKPQLVTKNKVLPIIEGVWYE